MPRANRYFVPGHVWHLTHRCHGGDFLLRFVRDRRRWTMWLFEAKKRYGLSILNYVATSNHVHLLVHSVGDPMTIPNAVQLIAGRVAQEFNLRKQRKGAFWEDRYHATAVETGCHLRRCMTYIDLNMVRAGVVKHPAEWGCCGYCEIQDPPRRYQRIDMAALAGLLELPAAEDVRLWQRNAVRESLEAMAGQTRSRCPEWTESIAVGNEQYLRAIKAEIGMAAYHRKISPVGKTAAMLCETSGYYDVGNGEEMDWLKGENLIDWQLST